MNEIQQINDDLETIEKSLTDLAQEYRADAKATANAEVDYELKYAEIILSLDDGTVQEKEAAATQACKEELRNKKVKKAVERGTRKALDVAQGNLSSIQTRASLIKSERYLDSYRT